uniref:Rho-GAP domain-containing protein n=1 Tax=Rodentolepis nana TaxID=102285 RepID=A0A0R3TNP8_RODNA
LTLLPGVQTNPRAGTVVPGTLDRIIGMLSVAAEELPDCPFYFQSDKLCSTIRATVPKMSLLSVDFIFLAYIVAFIKCSGNDEDT